MKRQLFAVLTALVLAGSFAHAASQLSGEAAQVIRGAGLSVYPNAVYLDGSPDFAAKFATSDTAEAVRNWYREKLPGWAVWVEGDMWVLYEGKPGLNPMEIMDKSRVLVGVNESLPIIRGLKEDMKTEIALSVPAQ
jgi:hypothetical protein